LRKVRGAGDFMSDSDEGESIKNEENVQNDVEIEKDEESY